MTAPVTTRTAPAAGRPDTVAAPDGVLVVGLDESVGSRSALAWAVADAGRSHRPVRLVAVFDPDLAPLVASGAGGPALVRTGVQETVDRHWALVDTAVRSVRHRDPRVEVTGDAVAGDPRRVLRDAAGPHGILVVGDHGPRGDGGPSTGATSSWLAAHAERATVVVRGPATPGPDHPVLLALDWFAPSHAAIDLARRFAADWDAPLVVVAAVDAELPVTAAAAPAGTRPADLAGTAATDLAGTAATDLAGTGTAARVIRTLRAALEETQRPSTRVVVAAGSPAAVVLSHAATAGLVVVGSHGRGAVRTMLLGSVGRELLRHSPCPVAVAHGRR